MLVYIFIRVRSHFSVITTALFIWTIFCKRWEGGFFSDLIAVASAAGKYKNVVRLDLASKPFSNAFLTICRSKTVMELAAANETITADDDRRLSQMALGTPYQSPFFFFFIINTAIVNAPTTPAKATTTRKIGGLSVGLPGWDAGLTVTRLWKTVISGSLLTVWVSL